MPLLQPLLHDLHTLVAAPTVALSGADGQVRREGAQGVLHADVRVLSEAVVTVDGYEPETVAAAVTGPGELRVTAVLRRLAGPPDAEVGHDPVVRLDRVRRVTPGRVEEELSVTSSLTAPLTATLGLAVAVDLAPVDEVKAGVVRAPVTPSRGEPGLLWEGPATAVRLEGEQASYDVEGDRAQLTWAVEVPGRGTWRSRWVLEVTDEGGAVVAAPRGRALPAPTVSAADRRLATWYERSVADLDALRMATRERPDDVFVAAGAPWYFTLFGRDSLWAARMSLPLGTDLAAGTLRALAALQGTRHDVAAAEAPGKILHELRPATAEHGGAMSLPPRYYGTVDATPLFVCLLHDAWRWGMPRDEVAALLPAAERALEWVRSEADEDGGGPHAGFLAYHDESGRGLANQGWKDSVDAVRYADGRWARGPVALCEVQGYAHEAAVGGAALLEAFGRPGAESLRRWAARLADRFADRFTVRDGSGPWPALALDGDGRPVDATTSNLGHLLGTGLLDPEAEAGVAERVTSSGLDSGLGLRTMSEADGGYAPLSYHCGSVWPHDTAVVVHGLVRSGHGRLATGLVGGLLAAAEHWQGRLPELWSGEGAPAVPYPAACRPQAWSAAAAVSVLASVAGLRPDVPGGTVTLDPGPDAGDLVVDGVVLGGRPARVEVRGGRTTLDAPGLSVVSRTMER